MVAILATWQTWKWVWAGFMILLIAGSIAGILLTISWINEGLDKRMASDRDEECETLC
jgi:hypothetical protein